jgi:type II secretory ATPase GspE/PulE/Tfp pilus assembly ATPase PilB-like protein
MVGEIRDEETAEISAHAALTGHLVLSTLHTNSSAETLTRLLNMGVPAFNVASSVTLIMAQRLAHVVTYKYKIIIPQKCLDKLNPISSICLPNLYDGKDFNGFEALLKW